MTKVNEKTVVISGEAVHAVPTNELRKEYFHYAQQDYVVVNAGNHTIVALGPDVKSKLYEGDKVVYEAAPTATYDVGSDSFIVMKEADILVRLVENK